MWKEEVNINLTKRDIVIFNAENKHKIKTKNEMLMEYAIENIEVLKGANVNLEE